LEERCTVAVVLPIPDLYIALPRPASFFLLVRSFSALMNQEPSFFPVLGRRYR
jgi:hypothetical protein